MSSLSLSGSSTEPGLRRQTSLIAFWALGALVFLLPVIFPLGIGRDYPNHLARVFIQYRLEGDALLAANYGLEWRLIPDLAMDLFAAPLAGWLSPYLVGGLFNGLTLLLLFSAGVALQRRHSGEISLWSLLPVALLFNEALLWGFMNFLFAVGLALWLVYFWLESENWPRGRRLLIFAAAQLCLFFAHLLGFLLCGYLILGLELARIWRNREAELRDNLVVFVRHMMIFALPLLLFGYVLLLQDGVGDSRTAYGGLGAKALAFLSPTSGLTPPLGPLILLALLLLGYGLLRTRFARLDKALQPLLWPMLFLVAVMPNMVLGIWGLDFRFPFVALLLFLVAVQPDPQLASTRLAQVALLAVSFGAVAAGGFLLAQNDRAQQEIREALARTEAGGALLVAGDYDPACPGCFPEWIDYMHSGALAAIEQRMFVPLLFTATSPVAASPKRSRLDVPHGWPVSRRALLDGRERPLERPKGAHDPAHAYWHDWPRHFDYLLWLRAGEADLRDLDGLERIAEGRAFVLYRIIAPVPRGGSAR